MHEYRPIGCDVMMKHSQLGSLFSLPRAVYAMAEDGLIFGWWGRVNAWTKVSTNEINVLCSKSIRIAVLHWKVPLISLTYWRWNVTREFLKRNWIDENLNHFVKNCEWFAYIVQRSKIRDQLCRHPSTRRSPSRFSRWSSRWPSIWTPSSTFSPSVRIF